LLITPFFSNSQYGVIASVLQPLRRNASSQWHNTNYRLFKERNMAASTSAAYFGIDDREYNRRIRAWTMYDWANSAFATTVLAAVLPIYFSQVAGSTLPSAAVATSYWSIGLSISLLIAALISPIFGTVSDIMRGKKRFLAIFAGLGVVSTAFLVLVDTGDWMLASIVGVLGRIGFNAANTFYDALLPHVARPEDQDKVSARGYAMGYVGGGLLLAINVAMIQMLPGTWGPRLSFLSVAIWWAVFTIPILRRVPEPHTALAHLKPGESVFTAGFERLATTLRDIRQYSELFKYLLAFLIYVDGIGTIYGVAAIYGAELGFGSVELILALLLVQFVGIPYSLIFGRLPDRNEKRRPLFLAFVLYNLIALPLTGVIGMRLLPANIAGAPPAPFAATATAVGQGIFLANDASLARSGAWQYTTVSAQELGAEEDAEYALSPEVGASYSLPFNGQKVEITFSNGPDHGVWAVTLDGQPYLDEDTGKPYTIDAYRATVRYGVSEIFIAAAPGAHTLTLTNTAERNPQSSGNVLSLAQIEVLPPSRESNLGLILGLILAVEAVGVVLALLLGRRLLARLAENMDTKRSIGLALAVYAVIAIWGYFLNSVVEYWLLAWMVAVVQGGSQALSRSLFAYLSPASKSGEFFGLFGIMEKFSAFLGPLVFAFAAATFGNSRPAVLSIIVFFFVGGFLLTRVNVAAGRRVALAEDAAALTEA
jgi:UMF1 family MFS transporter